MTTRLVECVPNFSEGRDRKVIDSITDAMVASGGVRLMDVDPGEATNRTVVTIVGPPTPSWMRPSRGSPRPPRSST